MKKESEIHKSKMSETSKWIIGIIASIIATVCGAWYSDYKSAKNSKESNENQKENTIKVVEKVEEQMSQVDSLKKQVFVLAQNFNAMLIDKTNQYNNPQDFPEEYKPELRAAAERIKNPETAKEYFLLYYVAKMDDNYDDASNYLQKWIISEPERASKKRFPYSNKEEAEEYGKNLWKNWNIANTIKYDSSKLQNKYEVVLVAVNPDHDGSGKFVLRNDLTTEEAAVVYSQLLRTEKHIENEIINKGFWIVCKEETPKKFLVSVGAFPEREKAEEFGKNLNIKYEFIYYYDKGGVYRVIVHSCDNKSEADEYVEEYKQEYKTDQVWFF